MYYDNNTMSARWKVNWQMKKTTHDTETKIIKIAFFSLILDVWIYIKTFQEFVQLYELNSKKKERDK